MKDDDLSRYETVADRRVKFLKGEWKKEFEKLGYFIQKNITWIVPGKEVMVEAVLFKLEKDGNIIRLGNAFAFENRDMSDFNKVNFLETAETSAVGRLLVEVGIGKGPSFEEMKQSMKKQAVLKKQVKKGFTIKETLERLKVDYTIRDDDTYVVSLDGIQDKTIGVLVRYGFEEVDGVLIAKKEEDEK